MRFLTSAQIKANKKTDQDLKANKICGSCGQPFSKVKRSKRLEDCCETCEKDFD